MKGFIAIAIGILAFTASMFYGIFYIDRISCTNYGELTKQDTVWTATTGCMVNANGTWKPTNNTLEIK
jgi:hypothetical protein